MKFQEFSAEKSESLTGRSLLTMTSAFAISCALSSCSAPQGQKRGGALNVAPGALQVTAMAEDGNKFVTQQLASLKPDWRGADFEKNLDSRLDTKIVDKAMQRYSMVMGPIVKISPVETGPHKLDSAGGQPDYIGGYRAFLDCGKGRAMALMVAEHMNGKWSVQSFNLKSNQFRKLDAMESKGAMEFADKFTKDWVAAGYPVDMVNKIADADLGKQLQTHQQQMKDTCAVLKKLGKVQKMTGSKLQLVSPAPDGLAFKIDSGLDFEKVHADLILGVRQYGKEYKLHGLAVVSKPITAANKGTASKGGANIGTTNNGTTNNGTTNNGTTNNGTAR